MVFSRPIGKSDKRYKKAFIVNEKEEIYAKQVITAISFAISKGYDIKTINEMTPKELDMIVSTLSPAKKEPLTADNIPTVKTDPIKNIKKDDLEDMNEADKLMYSILYGKDWKGKVEQQNQGHNIA